MTYYFNHDQRYAGKPLSLIVFPSSKTDNLFLGSIKQFVSVLKATVHL